MNKLCLLYGVEQVAEDVNLKDRYDVADYIGQFIIEVYNEEIRNSRNGVCESIANSRAGKCYNVDKAVALMKQ